MHVGRQESQSWEDRWNSSRPRSTDPIRDTDSRELPPDTDAAADVVRRLQARVDRHRWLLGRMQSDPLQPEPAGLTELLDTVLRMRRDTESLLLLHGQDPGVRATGVRRLSDVLGAAAAASEEPRRVEVRSVPEATVTPAAATELLHVLAEVVDHVTAVYPGARVDVSCHVEAPGGVAVEVRADGATRHDPDGLGGRRALGAAQRLARRSLSGIVLRTPDPGVTASGPVASIHCPGSVVSVDPTPVGRPERPRQSPASRPSSSQSSTASRSSASLPAVSRPATSRPAVAPSSGARPAAANVPAAGRSATSWSVDRQRPPADSRSADSRSADSQRSDMQRPDTPRSDPGRPESPRSDPPRSDPPRSDPPRPDPARPDPPRPDPLSDPLGPDPLGLGAISLDSLWTEPTRLEPPSPDPFQPDFSHPGSRRPEPARPEPRLPSRTNGNGRANGAGGGFGTPAPAHVPPAGSEVDELFGPLLDLAHDPAADGGATPIFEAIASAWFREDEPAAAAVDDTTRGHRGGANGARNGGSRHGGGAPEGDREGPVRTNGGVPRNWETPSDSEWRAAAERAARPDPEAQTSNGLPRRRPGNQLVPPPRGGAGVPEPERAERVPDRVRDRLSTYQRGLRQGRHRADPGVTDADPGDPAAW